MRDSIKISSLSFSTFKKSLEKFSFNNPIFSSKDISKSFVFLGMICSKFLGIYSFFSLSIVRAEISSFTFSVEESFTFGNRAFLNCAKLQSISMSGQISISLSDEIFCNCASLQ